ncbi:MAG TPA: tyrosine--tRNA ligase [Nitriliruptorales bacterium]|nr:tyrosine--tRNA ligase [Nitriliruptorales bacterium]
MTPPNPLDLLRERGFVHDVTDEDGLRRLLGTQRVTYYVGFDPTAPSLHVGSLVGMMAMAWLQRCGHRPIAIAGGATGRIGDPSGRDIERELLDDAQLEANLAGIEGQLSRFLDLSPPDRGLLLDNHEWLGRFGFLEFLRDVGKHFSVNAMVARESVRRRLEAREQGISYTEFSYQLLQAYDFANLYATHGCRLQGGGTDQWGNITAGVDLTRRLHGGQVYGLVWPLIEGAAGQKFSKTAGNAPWLSADITSPFAYYQWWLNTHDDDVGRFLRLFTFLPLQEVAELERAHGQDPSRRVAQRRLAEEATRLLHGVEGLAQARGATDVLFGGRRFAGLDDRVLAEAFGAAPSVELDRDRLREGLGLLELMTAVGAAASNSAARRLVEQGGVQLNNERVVDPTRRIGPEDLASERMLVLQVGRKRHYLARFV